MWERERQRKIEKIRAATCSWCRRLAKIFIESILDGGGLTSSREKSKSYFGNALFYHSNCYPLCYLGQNSALLCARFHDSP